jgi:Family of unknown function (DUF5678)
MDQATFDRETAIHRKAYEALKEQIRTEYAGKYIALAYGRIVAASPSYDEVEAAVEQLQPKPEYYLIFPAEMEPPFEPVLDY